MRREEARRRNARRISNRRGSTRRLSRLETLEDRELFAADGDMLGLSQPDHLATEPQSAEVQVVQQTGENSTRDSSTSQSSSGFHRMWQEAVSDVLSAAQEALQDVPIPIEPTDPVGPQIPGGIASLPQERIDLGQAGHMDWGALAEKMMDPQWYESFNQAQRDQVGFNVLDPEPHEETWVDSLMDAGDYLYELGVELDNNLPSGTIGGGVGYNVQLGNVHVNVQLDVYISHDAHADSWWNTWTIGIGPTVQGGFDGMGIGVGLDGHFTISDARRASMMNRPWFTVIGVHGIEELSVESFYAPGIESEGVQDIHGTTIGWGPSLGIGMYADNDVDTRIIHTGDPAPLPQAR